jgi:hypothetical protein
MGRFIEDAFYDVPFFEFHWLYWVGLPGCSRKAGPVQCLFCRQAPWAFLSVQEVSNRRVAVTLLYRRREQSRRLSGGWRVPDAGRIWGPKACSYRRKGLWSPACVRRLFIRAGRCRRGRADVGGRCTHVALTGLSVGADYAAIWPCSITCRLAASRSCSSLASALT